MERFFKKKNIDSKFSRIMLFQRKWNWFDIRRNDWWQFKFHVPSISDLPQLDSLFFFSLSLSSTQNHTFWWRNIFLCILSAIRYFQQRGVRSSKFQSGQQRTVTATRKIYWCTNARSIENQRAPVAQKLCFSRARSEREMDIPR